MKGPSLHVIALLKGVVEGDPYQHFASLLGYDDHIREAVELGLVTCGDGIQPTPVGMELYGRAEMWRLPAGRANEWPTSARVFLAIVQAAFQRLGRCGEG